MPFTELREIRGGGDLGAGMAVAKAGLVWTFGVGTFYGTCLWNIQMEASNAHRYILVCKVQFV